MSDRVLIVVGNRLLCFPLDVFAAAVREGYASVDEIGSNANTSAVVVQPGDVRLLTAEEAARLLALPARQLLRLAREGRIDHVRVGKHVRFSSKTIIEQVTRLARA